MTKIGRGWYITNIFKRLTSLRIQKISKKSQDKEDDC